MEVLEALMIGLLGSFHCIGMCGPIALALPLKQHSTGERLLSSALYNGGRILTYGAMGLLFGALGKGLYLGGLQQWTSIVLGTVMILSVAFPLLFRRIRLEEKVDAALAGMKRGFSRLLSIRTYRSLFLIGLLNGLLPCGLVYIALAGAIVSGEPARGALFMVLFGLGTFPVMFLLPLAGRFISRKYRSAVTRILPIFIILIGILFILRGMNLGIPYISPQIEKHTMKAKCCHPT